MARRIGQYQKETARLVVLRITHTARGENNNVDSSVGKSMLRTNGYF